MWQVNLRGRNTLGLGVRPGPPSQMAVFGRPSVEVVFQKSKRELRQSHYEGRTYAGLLRHCHSVALALLSLETVATLVEKRFPWSPSFARQPADANILTREADMSTIAKPLAPEDIARLEDDPQVELLAGELVERDMSTWTTMIGGRIYRLLADYFDGTPGGMALPDGVGYRCFATDSELVRKPDVSVFIPARWNPQLAESTYVEFAPDLVVEVVSPNDSTYPLAEKVNQFFAAGTREAWIVYPNTRQLERRFADGAARWYKASETLAGEPLLPGFAMTLEAVLTAAR